jgi:hypothetical protein
MVILFNGSGVVVDVGSGVFCDAGWVGPFPPQADRVKIVRRIIEARNLAVLRLEIIS